MLILELFDVVSSQISQVYEECATLQDSSENKIEFNECGNNKVKKHVKFDKSYGGEDTTEAVEEEKQKFSVIRKISSSIMKQLVMSNTNKRDKAIALLNDNSQQIDVSNAKDK